MYELILLQSASVTTTTFIASFVDLTIWFSFWLIIFFLWLPANLRRGIVHETLDHMRPDQSKPTECSLLHHEYCERRVEICLIWQLLIKSNTKDVHMQA